MSSYYSSFFGYSSRFCYSIDFDTGYTLNILNAWLLQVWRRGRVAMQRIANPCTPVRLRSVPPKAF